MFYIEKNIKYSDIIFDESDEVLLAEYFEQLKRQFWKATGEENANIGEVLEWFEERKNIVELFAEHIENIWNKSKPIGFMDNTVEVGTVGQYNTITKYVPFASIISKYGFTINKPCTHSFKGILLPTDKSIEVLVSEKGDTIYPRVEDFRTFILNNPTKDDKMTLESLKHISLQKPTTIVGVYGSKNDKDFLQKSDFIKNFCDELREFYESFDSFSTPTFSLRESEKDEFYVKTVITRQLFHTGSSPKIIQKSLRPEKRK